MVVEHLWKLSVLLLLPGKTGAEYVMLLQLTPFVGMAETRRGTLVAVELSQTLAVE